MLDDAVVESNKLAKLSPLEKWIMAPRIEKQKIVSREHFCQAVIEVTGENPYDNYNDCDDISHLMRMS